MDLTKRLAIPVQLTVDEMKDIVNGRVEQGRGHGLRLLVADLDGYYWRDAVSHPNGMPDVTWRASQDRYAIKDLSDLELNDVLAARLSKATPALAGIACNIVMMLEEAKSLLACLSPDDLEAVNSIFKKGSDFEGLLQSSLAAAQLVARVAEHRQDHDVRDTPEIG